MLSPTTVPDKPPIIDPITPPTPGSKVLPKAKPTAVPPMPPNKPSIVESDKSEVVVQNWEPAILPSK